METIHHAMMSEQWAREQGCDEDMTREIAFWSMMPDLVLVLYGYAHRGHTHMEDDESIMGSQLHHTASDLSLIPISPIVPILPGMACVAHMGIHLHLAQDRAYDKWLSRYVGVARDAHGEWAYFRRCDGALVSPMDVALLKRWSWRCAWMDTIADKLSDEELRGEKFSEYLKQRFVAPAQRNTYWHPAMENKISELWTAEMAQERVPEPFANEEDEMRTELVHAWETWKGTLFR